MPRSSTGRDGLIVSRKTGTLSRVARAALVSGGLAGPLIYAAFLVDLVEYEWTIGVHLMQSVVHLQESRPLGGRSRIEVWVSRTRDEWIHVAIILIYSMKEAERERRRSRAGGGGEDVGYVEVPTYEVEPLQPGSSSCNYPWTIELQPCRSCSMISCGDIRSIRLSYVRGTCIYLGTLPIIP